MNCYHCHRPLKAKVLSGNFDCDDCTHEFQMDYVINSEDDKGQPLYFHIYLTIKEIRYHIRLHLKENLTNIAYEIDETEGRAYTTLLTLDGFPISLLNAKQKLQTILTFL